MTRDDDRREPGGLRACPRPLAQGLMILAQFHSERVVLGQTDIARLADCSCSIAQRYLLTLSELGYLTQAPDGRYRLAGPT